PPVTPGIPPATAKPPDGAGPHSGLPPPLPSRFSRKSPRKTPHSLGLSLKKRTFTPLMNFQDLVLTLPKYSSDRNCLIAQPYGVEKGAATFNPATFLRSLGPEPWNAAWIEPCRRPKDGRYGDNPNRGQHYYQFQVVLKPSPLDIVDQYLGSLR